MIDRSGTTAERNSEQQRRGENEVRPHDDEKLLFQQVKTKKTTSSVNGQRLKQL